MPNLPRGATALVVPALRLPGASQNRIGIGSVRNIELIRQ
jgi:hypothetical protein